MCHDYVHVDATAATTTRRSTGAFADAIGAQLAINGDFYRTDPILRVYGDAVGGGVEWPTNQTGTDPGYSWEWFYQNYGWIAVGPDWVEFNHTEWVKESSGLTLREGWANETVSPDPPAGTLALVSGFPELVTEGVVRTCASPTNDSCFPDRGDMQDRHPRSAMGLSADRQTLIFAVVDGRTAQSAGMYGAELAWLMGELGAWQAFNLDGGGSSQFWTESGGYLNDASGNTGGGICAVTNHWGVYAGAGSGMPVAPGHCVSGYEPPPCQLLGPRGGVLEEVGPCFDSFGPLTYWRFVDGAGHGGSLLWTNAFASANPSNWARWNIYLQSAGEYRVEVFTNPEYAVYTATRYELRAAGAEQTLTVDQSVGDGWLSIGDFAFEAGGDQYLSVFDNYSGTVARDQHIQVDAIRLTRLGCEETELCNGRDDDCDDIVPDDELDGDGDGLSPCEGDCDDSDRDLTDNCDAGDVVPIEPTPDGGLEPQDAGEQDGFSDADPSDSGSVDDMSLEPDSHDSAQTDPSAEPDSMPADQTDCSECDDAEEEEGGSERQGDFDTGSGTVLRSEDSPFFCCPTGCGTVLRQCWRTH